MQAAVGQPRAWTPCVLSVLSAWSRTHSYTHARSLAPTCTSTWTSEGYRNSQYYMHLQKQWLSGSMVV